MMTGYLHGNVGAYQYVSALTGWCVCILWYSLAELVLTGLHWYLLGYFGTHWAELVLTGLNWYSPG